MADIPAPFLNRFEKYRLTLEDVLAAGWSKFGSMRAIILKAQARVAAVSRALEQRSEAFGWLASEKTSESIFIDMIPQLDDQIWLDAASEVEPFFARTNKFGSVLTEFLQKYTSLSNISDHVDHAVAMAKEVLPIEFADSLDSLLAKEANVCSLEKSLQAIVEGKADRKSITTIYVSLMQMIITRASVFRLIRLATPESIFLNR